MKLFKTLFVSLIIVSSLNVFAQTKEEVIKNDASFLKCIPAIEDFINGLLYPSRDDLRNQPGNTQSA